jgi:hypothetical protein
MSQTILGFTATEIRFNSFQSKTVVKNFKDAKYE